MPESKSGALPLGYTPTGSSANEGFWLIPCATQPLRSSGNALITSWPARSFSTSIKAADPLPVICALPNWPNQSRHCPTAGYRFRATGSRSFRRLPLNGPGILIGGVFRVNSGSENTALVGTLTPGHTTQKHPDGRIAGVRRSPIPSPQAERPATKSGTSAPRSFAISRSCSSRRPKGPDLIQRNQRCGSIRTSAAKARAHRYSFIKMNPYAQRLVAKRSQSCRGA